MTEKQVRQDILYLYSKLSAREGKYIRNMNRYMNNGVRREDIWTPYVAPQAYVVPAVGSDGVQTQLNIGKSCVDTITSKISQANVRPFFDPDMGDFTTTKACRQIQHFSDVWLDEQHAYPKSVLCFRDAAIYDIGVMKIDPEAQSIDRIAPWEYFLDPSEHYHGHVARCMHYRKNYPLSALIGITDNSKLKKQFESDFNHKDEYVIYYDLYKGFRYDFYGREMVKEPVKLDYEQYGGLYRRPFVEIYFTKPLKGFFSVSLMDDLYPLQRNLDDLMKRVDNATRNALINLILVPKGSNLKASNLQNGVSAYDYTPGPDGGAPIVMSPPAINDQYLQFVKWNIDQMYQIAGISQLSAQSQKPAGLDSGAALKTMEDIESDRFNVQLQQFTHFLVDVMRVSIDCFPKSAAVLPKKAGRPNITWGEIRKQRDLFSIDFSAASALSKDPSAKIAEIKELLQMGYIDDEIGASLLQLPDLNGANIMATASIDYVNKIIDDAVEKEIYEFEQTVNLKLLFKRAVSCINQFSAAGDEQAVKRIKELVRNIYNLQQNLQMASVQNQPQKPPAPPPQPVPVTLVQQPVQPGPPQPAPPVQPVQPVQPVA